MEISHPDMCPPSILDTLTVAEMGGDPNAFEKAQKMGWKNPFTLKEPNRLVYLRVSDHQVVKGWLATHLRCRPRTFWTWDHRFTYETPTGGTMPGNIEPLGWCEIIGD